MRTRGRVPVVSAYEYGPINLPAGVDTVRIRDRLIAAGLRAGFQVFESRGRRLFAQGVVGVIDVGDVIVEILPKTGDGSHPSECASFLGNLVRFVGETNALSLAIADIAMGDAGLLEVVLAWIVHTVASNLREGTPRRYVMREEMSTAIRGRVELRHLVHQRPGRAFELTVRHAPLHVDNIVSQIVRWLVNEVGQRTLSLRTKALSLQLLHTLSDVRQITPTLADIDRLSLNPMESHWRPIIELTRAFLAQGEPDPARGGSLPAVAVLFTLHDLFEAAVRRVLREELPYRALALKRGADHLLIPEDSQFGVMRLRPDFLLGDDRTAAKIVGDAKWKRIFDGSGLPHVRESDVYQVVTYMAALRVEVGFLVCPLSDGEPETLRRSAFNVLGVARPLYVLGIRLPLLIEKSSEGSELRKRFCDSIIGTLSADSAAA